MMEMALQLLLGVLKKGLVHGPHADADSQALLGPLLPLLTAALQSRHAPCTSLALRCLASVSAPPLSGQLRNTALHLANELCAADASNLLLHLIYASYRAASALSVPIRP